MLDESTKQAVQSRKQEIMSRVADKQNEPGRRKSPPKKKMSKEEELGKLDLTLDKEINSALHGVSRTLQTIYK